MFESEFGYNATVATLVGRPHRRRGALLLVALSVASCENGTPGLTIDLRTDLLPGEEFSVVVAEVSPTSDPSVVFREELRVDSDQDFQTGIRVFDREIPSGDYLVEARLVNGIEFVASRTVAVAVGESRFATTLSIQRTCAGIRCPRDTDDATATGCFDGRCVPPQCQDDALDMCGTPPCAADNDCPGASPCAPGLCANGVCFCVRAG